MERLLYEDQQLRITVLAAPPDPAVRLCGEIDVTNSPALARALALSREGCPRLIVDTGALSFIDLSGIRVLVMPALPPTERWIRLRNITPCQRRMLELMGWFQDAHPVAVPHT
ncbi:STAS domain-containing protein [Nonomuraea sp. SBT364]|uniref:STAS domain-containing protein n=1 Tax=Nonomuraea sp. SBT364 TaxID=1580530 RepID=UPI0018CF481B|nr:STAS domain-containing protein [Nonomuraea sp. SBT364]